MRIKKSLFIITVLCVFLMSGCASSKETQLNEYENKETELEVQFEDKTKISEQEAIDLIKQYLSNNGYHMSSNIDVDSVDGDKYIVHAYDVITNEDESHTATTGWFEVDMYTKEIKDIMK